MSTDPQGASASPTPNSPSLGASGSLAARVEAALERVLEELFSRRTAEGHWVGELSTSALSTATAVTALSLVRRHGSGDPADDTRIARGLAWLANHANPDGGWGDTTDSLSNLSTTVLCWAAFGAVPGAEEAQREVVGRAENWICQRIGLSGRFSPGEHTSRLADSISGRYGRDRTFSAPILTMCALAGRLGDDRHAWDHVIQLPFELAVFPPSFFAALRLPVVSYALPALIAIGLVRHIRRPSRNPIARATRQLAVKRTLSILFAIQPSSGGFLEATPLTSFVVMSLAGSGRASDPVASQGVKFLIRSQRSDGGWPIDTNLATWVTTLAINGLPSARLSSSVSVVLSEWLLNQQHRQIHPYTQAQAGGWAWTDLSGGVPDTDDTAGAMVALKRLWQVATRNNDNMLATRIRDAALLGGNWLSNIQNRDGGIPTFCKGWGTLPFDRSSPDLTAHALRAWHAWREHFPQGERARMGRCIAKALGYLGATQRPDGSWVPLWFGNQAAPEEENPLYGTARVVTALSGLGSSLPPGASEAGRGHPSMLTLGARWLVGSQNADGGWGGNRGVRSSVEESALAVEALSAVAQSESAEEAGVAGALERGVRWLVRSVEQGEWKTTAPIGFYFAKLWYSEQLYPQVFTTAALARWLSGNKPVH